MIERVTEEENMLTVFLPMGPNPFMGGFMMHMSEEEVYRLDLSVEEGISSIVSFGVAVEIDDRPPDVPVNLDKIQKDGCYRGVKSGIRKPSSPLTPSQWGDCHCVSVPTQ